MASTAISILPVPISPFSLQAATWSFETHAYTLRDKGCIVADGTQNCSKVCTSVDSIFSSGATFQNCLSYPFISHFLGSSDAQASGGAIEAYGIIPNDTKGSGLVVSTINSCLKGYANSITSCAATGGTCTGNDYGACSTFFESSGDDGMLSASNGSDPLTSSAFQCVNTICEYVAANAKVSADFGGIGVFVGYIFQISIVLFCWLVIEYFRLLHPFITRRLQRHEHTIFKIHTTTQKEMFTEAVIDFHRVQCYFMSIILLAAIIATQSQGLEASSLQQVFNNLVLLSILSIGGSLPIMFMLFKLRLAGHRSWYTFILSSITLVLAIVLTFSSGPHKTLSTDLLQPKQSNIPGCGSIDPTQLCLQGSSAWRPGEGTTEGWISSLYSEGQTQSDAAVAISLVLWLGLLFDKLRKLNFDKLVNRLMPKKALPAEKKQDKAYSFWTRILLGILDCAVCAATLFLLIEYLRDLVTLGYGPTEWSFGQLVAITIWIPPFAQYAYLQVNGVEGGRWHLPDTLIVSREREEDEEKERSRSVSRPGRGRAKNTVDLVELGLDKNSLDLRRSSQVRAMSQQRRPSRMNERSISRTRHEDRRASRIVDISSEQPEDETEDKNKQESRIGMTE